MEGRLIRTKNQKSKIINYFKRNNLESDLNCVLQRFKMTMTPAYYLANLLDH